MRAPLHIAYQMVVIMALGGIAGIYCKNTFPIYGLWYMIGYPAFCFGCGCLPSHKRFSLMVFFIWTSYFVFALVIYYAGNKLIVNNDAQHLKWTFAFSAIKTIAALVLFVGLHLMDILPINKQNALIFVGFYFVHLLITSLLAIRGRL